MWKDKLTSYNGETITYDGIGNPLKYRNGMTMQWKNGRQLSQVKTSKDTITYKYNIKGLRTRKYNSDYTYYYYYDDNNNLIAMMQGGVVAYFYYDSNNSVTAMSINDSMYYYVKNLQGDITKIVNHQGKVMVEYTYDAWGNILKEKSNVSPSYATVKDFNPFRYRGYVYDTDTGLYYLQTRYYDPKTGRFINADDTAYVDTNSGTPLSTNMFAYCENNYINDVDPSGFWSFSSNWVSYSIDLIICVFGTAASVCFSVIKMVVKNNLKRIGIKRTAKFIIKYIIPKCVRFMKKFMNNLSYIISKVTWFTFDFWKTSKISSIVHKVLRLLKGRRIDIIYNVVSMFLSPGSYIAGILDLVSDGKLDGRITV